jgi:hypothetical protein
MLDMSGILKPEIIGEGNSLSISFLAACASDQYAYEDPENQAGVATTEILGYLIGEKVLHDTRPFLDLIELGRAVSTEVLAKRADQTPVAWGLNLYGQGTFARNPHYSGDAEFPLRVVRIAPNSDIGRRLQRYSEALWAEYRQVVTDPSHRRLVNLLGEVCSDLEGNGESCLPFIKGVATSLRARAEASPDLFAESDVLACCAVALLPYCQSEEGREVVRDLVAERSRFDGRIRRELEQGLRDNRYYLLSPVGSAGDFYYLPLRVSRVLGWLGATIVTDTLLGTTQDEVREEVRRLVERVLDLYAGSLVATSDEQAPYVYLFAKACRMCGWDDLASAALDGYFQSAVSVGGAVARGNLDPAEAFSYTIIRGLGQARQAYKLTANPSDFIAILLLCGAGEGLADRWDTRLRALDHKSVNFYLPDDYSAFWAERIVNGRNYTFYIGNGVWTLADLAEEFGRSCMPKMVENETITLPEARALCVLSSYLFPNRVPYFLKVITNEGSSSEVDKDMSARRL